MKTLITSYTFDKVAKTVTFTGLTAIVLEQIMLITDVTSNVIIYNFADPAKGGAVATNVLTLDYDTSALVNTDKLQIWYDDGNGYNTIRTKLPDVVTGNITANSQTFEIDTSGDVGSVSVSIAGTYAGVNLQFEVYDGVNWFSTLGSATNNATPTPAATTGVLTANSTLGYNIPFVGGFTRFRVRVIAWTSGTGNLRIMPSRSVVPDHAFITGTLTTVTPGTAATNLGKAEDAAAVSGDTGVFTLGIRRDGAITTSPTSAAGDYQEFAQDQYGQIRTAAQARTTNPTAAADGNGIIPIYDKLGKQVVVGSVRDLKSSSAMLTLTASTTETSLIAAVASTFNDIYGIVVTNTSATATEVEFRDVTAGTVRFSIMVPAGDTRGFMLNESAAFKQATVNTAWTAKCITSVSSVKITALYVANT